MSVDGHEIRKEISGPTLINDQHRGYKEKASIFTAGYQEPQEEKLKRKWIENKKHLQNKHFEKHNCPMCGSLAHKTKLIILNTTQKIKMLLYVY